MSNLQSKKLAEVIARELPFAIKHLLNEIHAETPYGFCLYTDDSATGIDLAINTIERFKMKTSRRKYESFEYYWYSTEWEIEGGAYVFFEKTHEFIEGIEPDWEHDSQKSIDQFRETVFESMFLGLLSLVDSGFFESISQIHGKVIQVCITDSEDDERVREDSIKKLNPPEVVEKYLKEKREAYS